MSASFKQFYGMQILLDRKLEYMYNPSFLNQTDLFLDTFLMVLFAISGVFSGFNNIAGNTYFALLPVQEGTAALCFIIDCHYATLLAAPTHFIFQTR